MGKSLGRLLLLVATLAAAAVGDTVLLKNGDRITGKVQIEVGSALKIETPYAGVVTIDWAQVAQLLTDDIVPIQLKNGEHLKGRLIESDTGTITVRSDIAGDTKAIAIENIEGIRKSKEEWTELDYWSGQLSAGMTISDGNTRRKTYYGRAEVIRRTDGSRLTLTGRTNYASESGDEVEKNNYGALKLDVFITDRLYVYGLTSFEYDHFASINLRTTISAGLGYQLVRTENHELDVEAGIAYINEDRRHDEDEDFAAARGAIAYRWKISDRLRFRALLEVLENLEDTKDFLVHGESFLYFEVWKNLNLEAGVVWDHDQIPPEGRLRNDTQYLMGVTYRF